MHALDATEIISSFGISDIWASAQNVIACNADADDDGWSWSMEAAVTALALSLVFYYLIRKKCLNQKIWINSCADKTMILCVTYYKTFTNQTNMLKLHFQTIS